MKIKTFKVEEWMNEYEDDAVYNIAETCVDSISLDELLALTGIDRNAFLDDLASQRLTYGAIQGAAPFKAGICGRYRNIQPENVLSTHGAAGANHLVFYSLIEPGDRVISVLPTYQQLYSIPEAFHADVQLLHLKKENDYLPDVEELRQLVNEKTKMICLNNPNNPTGALIPLDILKEIVAIARSVDAYILCDEVYRGLNQDGSYTESIVDLYEKGISVSSMSKIFSLAGVRLGWVASKDKAVIEACLSHRDYNMISCGMLDEMIAAAALKHADKLLERNIQLIQNNLAILDQWIAENPHFSYVKPKAGTTSLIYYDFDLDSYTFCKQMYAKTGAFVTPGDCFEQPHSFRIGYACEKQVLKDGLAAITRFVNQL